MVLAPVGSHNPAMAAGLTSNPSGALAIAIASAAVLVNATFALAQTGPDCRRAKSDAERAVCADPSLKVADSAMAKAYAALHALLPPAQRPALLDDQREWLGMRDAACREKGPDLAQCVLEQTEARRRFLDGETAGGNPGAPKLLPTFYREAGAHYKITVQYPQILGSAGRAATAFNALSRKLAFGGGPAGADAFRTDEALPAGEPKAFYDAGYEITYLDAHLASVVFSIGTYEGGAHPNGESTGLLFDFDHARSLALADFLANPTEAVPAIAAQCARQANDEDWGVFENADFAAVVGVVSSWLIDKDGAAILFNPYSVTPYVAGPHQCRIPYSELQRWLKPGSPLPPHVAAKD